MSAREMEWRCALTGFSHGGRDLSTLTCGEACVGCSSSQSIGLMEGFRDCYDLIKDQLFCYTKHFVALKMRK